MKLTKLQRYTAYCLLLAEAELIVIGKSKYDGGWFSCKPIVRLGLCNLINVMFGITDIGWESSCANVIEQNFPELYKKRPGHFKFRWFGPGTDGWKKRIEILKQCIKETSPD